MNQKKLMIMISSDLCIKLRKRKFFRDANISLWRKKWKHYCSQELMKLGQVRHYHADQQLQLLLALLLVLQKKLLLFLKAAKYL